MTYFILYSYSILQSLFIAQFQELTVTRFTMITLYNNCVCAQVIAKNNHLCSSSNVPRFNVIDRRFVLLLIDSGTGTRKNPNDTNLLAWLRST